MEFDTEVSIEEDFGVKRWTIRERLDLIWQVLIGGSWEFVGFDTVSIDPPDRY